MNVSVTGCVCGGIQCALLPRPCVGEIEGWGGDERSTVAGVGAGVFLSDVCACASVSVFTGAFACELVHARESACVGACARERVHRRACARERCGLTYRPHVDSPEPPAPVPSSRWPCIPSIGSASV